MKRCEVCLENPGVIEIEFPGDPVLICGECFAEHNTAVRRRG